MKLGKRMLSMAISAGLFGVVVPALAAQQTDTTGNAKKDAQELSAVVVTGSHIRRVTMETANPVLAIGHEQIMATGDLTLGKLLQDLPAMTGGATNPQYAHSHGGTQVSMRGLGSARTLILVDGRRVVSGDVNAIPAAMIERIEVLKNGASAVYGSDAIGGVVNFITKKHYQGAQFTARYGQSSHADARGKGYTFTFGQVGDKGSIIGGVGYKKVEGVASSERDFTRDVLELDTNDHGVPTVSVGGSTNSPFGRIQVPDAGPVHDAFPDCSHLARNPGASGMDAINDYHCYRNSGPNTDKYNYATDTQLLKPQERTNAFLLGTYHLSDHVSVYLDAYYNKSKATFEEAPTTYHTPQVTISADNYYNPFGVEFSRHGYSFRSRLLGMGLRSDHYSNTVTQIFTGFKGTFSMFDDQMWDWDVGMSYGHRHAGTLTLNYPNLDALYTGPSFLDAGTGKVTCGTPADPVTECDASFNPFNVQAPGSVAAEKNGTAPAIENAYRQQKIWHAQASGGLFDLPAGTMQLALGASYRKVHTRSVFGSLLIIDPVTGDCGLGVHCSRPLQGGYNVKEAYGELFIPILSGLPGAYGLNVTIGDRYSRFSSFGSTNNMEFKVEWRPLPSLLLRGSMEEVFRAPTVHDVFAPISSANPRISFDPCDGYTGSPVNPACVNVPTDGSFVNTLVAQDVASAIRTAGAKAAGFAIQPETGKSFDVGAVYSPSWVPGFTVSADVWHVYLDDVISHVNLQNLLNLCSNGQTQYCGLIHRYRSGPQQGQIAQATVEPIGNLGSLSTGGVDFSANYTLTTASIGRFNFNLNGTYLKYYTAQTAPGTRANQTFHYAGHYMPHGSAAASSCPGVGQCLFPRWRANGWVRWNWGNWRATWKIHYIGDFRMGSDIPSQDTHPAGSGIDGYYIDYGSSIYHNVSLSYDIEPIHTRFVIGVNNLFDNTPPILYDNNADYNIDQLNFDVIGRYYWARAVVSF